MLGIFNKELVQPPQELNSPASLNSSLKPKLPKEILNHFISHSSNAFSIGFGDAMSLAYIPPEKTYSIHQRYPLSLIFVICVFLLMGHAVLVNWLQGLVFLFPLSTSHLCENQTMSLSHQTPFVRQNLFWEKKNCIIHIDFICDWYNNLINWILQVVLWYRWDILHFPGEPKQSKQPHQAVWLIKGHKWGHVCDWGI